MSDYAVAGDDTLSVSLGAPTSDRLLLAFLYRLDDDDSGFVPGLSVAGAPTDEIIAARASQPFIPPNSFRAQAFHLVDASSSGAIDFVTAIPAGSNGLHLLAVYEFGGADGASPIGAVATKSGFGEDQTYALATTAPDSFVAAGFIGVRPPGTPAPGFLVDIDHDIAAAGFYLAWAGSRPTTAAASYPVGVTLPSGSGGAGCAIEIKAA
ncbi:MAG: hypothetical protein AAFX92_06100 [Pseudomonadota bacterium]